jgi:hypothetical protein
VVCHQEQVAAYMLIHGESLDHPYVAPVWQGLGFWHSFLRRQSSLVRAVLCSGVLVHEPVGIDCLVVRAG